MRPAGFRVFRKKTSSYISETSQGVYQRIGALVFDWIWIVFRESTLIYFNLVIILFFLTVLPMLCILSFLLFFSELGVVQLVLAAALVLLIAWGVLVELLVRHLPTERDADASEEVSEDSPIRKKTVWSRVTGSFGRVLQAFAKLFSGFTSKSAFFGLVVRLFGILLFLKYRFSDELTWVPIDENWISEASMRLYFLLVERPMVSTFQSVSNFLVDARSWFLLSFPHLFG